MHFAECVIYVLIASFLHMALQQAMDAENNKRSGRLLVTCHEDESVKGVVVAGGTVVNCSGSSTLFDLLLNLHAAYIDVAKESVCALCSMDSSKQSSAVHVSIIGHSYVRCLQEKTTFVQFTAVLCHQSHLVFIILLISSHLTLDCLSQLASVVSSIQ